MKNSQKRIAPFIVTLIAVIIIGGFYLYENKKVESENSTLITILVPDNESAYMMAMNEYVSNGGADPSKTWLFVKKDLAIPYVIDVVKASAQAAAEVVPSSGGPAKATVVYLKIQNNTAYILLDIDLNGWAGVSFSIAKIHPIIEKTLLQFPEIQNVVFGPSPGDTIESIIKNYQPN